MRRWWWFLLACVLIVLAGFAYAMWAGNDRFIAWGPLFLLGILAATIAGYLLAMQRMQVHLEEEMREEARITKEEMASEDVWRILPRERLAATTVEVLELAHQEAKVNRHDYLGTEHLFLALLAERRQADIRVLSRWPCNLEEE